MNVTWSNSSFVEEPDMEEVLRKYFDLYDTTMQVKKDNYILRKKLALVESEKNEAKVEHQSYLDNGEKLCHTPNLKIRMIIELGHE
ncbi:unnamed protein product [Malus baccata var. baccata]